MSLVLLVGVDNFLLPYALFLHLNQVLHLGFGLLVAFFIVPSSQFQLVSHFNGFMYVICDPLAARAVGDFLSANVLTG